MLHICILAPQATFVCNKLQLLQAARYPNIGVRSSADKFVLRAVDLNSGAWEAVGSHIPCGRFAPGSPPENALIMDVARHTFETSYFKTCGRALAQLTRRLAVSWKR